MTFVANKAGTDPMPDGYGAKDQMLSKPLQLQIAIASASTSLQIAGVPGKKICIRSLTLGVATAGFVALQSHTTTAKTTGTLPLAISNPLVVPEGPNDWFETVPGEGLDVVFTTGTNLNGTVNYTIV